MIRSRSMSSIHSISSESLNINSSDSLLLNKSKKRSLELCVNEFNLINKKLENKVLVLKLWEEKLRLKEIEIVNLCNSVTKYVQSEVSFKCSKIIKETEERYSDLEKRYNSLNKDFKRLQCSFDSIKAQNKTLKDRLSKEILNEEILVKERDRLIAKVAMLSCSNGLQTIIKQRSVLVQTVQMSTPKATPFPSYPCEADKRLDPIFSFSYILRELWYQMFKMATKDLFLLDLHESARLHNSFADICLLMIPMCIECLRVKIQTNIEESMPPSSQRRHKEVVGYHLEMLYWSIVYMDIGRIPLRPGIMSPLSRIGEDLASILVTKSSLSIRRWVSKENETHALIILLALRCVNQVDTLSLLMRYLDTTMTAQKSMATTLLSKLVLVPLLCRWTSAAACYVSLYPKILGLVLQTLDKRRDSLSTQEYTVSVTLDGLINIGSTGLDQLSFLITRLSINVTETTNGSTCHPLVFLLDILHTSKCAERDNILAIFESVIATKEIKALCRDLGMAGVVSGLISQCPDPTTSSVTRLRSLMAELTN